MFFFPLLSLMVTCFSFIILYWVTTRTGSHAVVLNKHTASILSSAAALESPSVLAPLCPLWLVSSHTPETVTLTPTEQLCWTTCYVTNQLLSRNYVKVGHGDLVWCHKVTELKAGLTTRCFRNTVFCGRGELSRPFTCTGTYRKRWMDKHNILL